MLKIAITGGAGSGKTEVCKKLQSLGACVISFDQLARSAVEPGTQVYASIVDFFGPQIILKNGSLDRSKLRRMLTMDESARHTLEKLIHPDVLQRFNELIQDIECADQTAVVAAEVPLLIEKGLQGLFDVVVLVESERSLQKTRLLQRDDLSADEADALLNIQMPPQKKRLYAHHIIENNATTESLNRAVEEIYLTICSQANSYQKKI